MLKRSIMAIVIVFGCNVYASQQQDRHSGKKAAVGALGTFLFGGIAHKGFECSAIPEYRFLTGATSALTVVAAVYTVNNMRKYYGLSKVEE